MNSIENLTLGKHQASSEIKNENEKNGDFAAKKIKKYQPDNVCLDGKPSSIVTYNRIHYRDLQTSVDSVLAANPEKGIAYFEKMPIEERYRFLVDGKLLKCENGAKSFEAREPGCLAGGAEVYEKILSSVRLFKSAHEFLDKEYIKALHKILFEPTRFPTQKGKTKKLQSQGMFRTKRVFIRISSNFTNKGLIEAQDFYKKVSPNEKNTFGVAVYKSSNPDARKIEKRVYPDAKDLPKYIQDKKNTVDFRPVKYEAVEAAVDDILLSARKRLENISTKKDLLSLLCELSSKLDQIHPFENGNIRIIRGLIDSIVMYYGFCPIIWEDPNIIDFYDIDKIFATMENSIQKSSDLITYLAKGEKKNDAYESSEDDKTLSRRVFLKSARI